MLLQQCAATAWEGEGLAFPCNTFCFTIKKYVLYIKVILLSVSVTKLCHQSVIASQSHLVIPAILSQLNVLISETSSNFLDCTLDANLDM